MGGDPFFIRVNSCPFAVIFYLRSFASIRGYD
jgi:hypothetical protein